MKSLITNQPSLKETRIRGQLTHASAAVVGAVAILLLGMMAASGGQKAAPSVQIRPIGDFLDAQGTLPFVPAELQSIGWTDSKTMRFAVVDYTGLANKWIKEQSPGTISLGTKTEGKVIERRLPDGRAEVTVLLHTKNALTWVAEFMPDNIPPVPPFGQLLFGRSAEEVLRGADPALGESLLMWVFINKAPGEPLPDLVAETLVGPTVETLMLSFEANAHGTLRGDFGVPDGTPGRAQINEIGLFPAGKDAKWPAEHINLKVVGR